MKRRLDVDSTGLKLRQLIPLLERYPDTEVSNANGHFLLYLEELPNHNDVPYPISEDESQAYNTLRAVDAMRAALVDVAWPEMRELSAEYVRKRELNCAAVRARDIASEAIRDELTKLIKETP